ncbi:MAG: SUMF1/EgtB/PvdO family nonheme iron enzyme, partial [Myxococcota bacterium]
ETEPAQPPLGVDGLDGAPKTDPLPAPLPASALIPVVEPDPAADILPVADVPAAPLAEPISAAPEANPSLAAALAAPAPIPPVDPAENAASARESLAPPRGIVEAFRPPRAEVAPRSEGAPRPAHRPKGAGRPAVPPPASITHSAGNGVHSPTNGRAYGQGRPKKKKRPMTRPRMAAVQPSATPARAQGSVPVVVAAAPTSNRLVYFTIAASFLMIMLAFLAVLKITTDQQRQSQAEIEALREQLLQDKRTQRVLDAIGSKGPQGRVDETKGSASDGASTAAETRKKQPRSAIERDGKGTESSDAERSSRIRRDKRASRKADAPSQKKKSAAKAASVAASRGTPSSASGRPCPTGMKLIASGPFMMGAQDSDPERNFDDLPYRSVNVSAVCMDLYEYPNARGRAPKTQVTWKAAVAQCERRGKRLCTESEWEKACKGPSGFRYAYGNRWEEGLCNTKEGLNAREAASSGQFAGCRSRYGLIDMTGNVAEWTSTANGRRYVIKGGAADRPSYDSRCAARKRKKKGHRAPLLGFRCCQDPS